jgi:ribosomal protein S12 methylthiotransferase RimO
MDKKLHLVSLGCTKNLVDSEVMLAKLKDYTITDDVSQADLIIVNTCGFIESAKQESLNIIFDLHNQRKEQSVLVMAGCLTQRYQQELQDELVEVDIFTGVGDYDQIDKLVQEKRTQFSQKVFLASQENERVITGSSYHAYIKLSEGCNQTCSFCAIPSFKGKLHSRELESITKEVKYLVSQGYFDFSFVSQDSSSYLRDFDINDGLQRLIKEIEKINGVKSARILYLYPSTTTLDLIDTIAKSNIFHSYYDMPLQHINSRILNKMRRGKGSQKLKELMDAMKKVENSFIRSTFIVGYPSETQEEFEELCNWVKEFEFDRVNVFSYSDEEGTYAYNAQDKIDQTIIDQRAEILGNIVEQTTQKSLEKQVGKTIKVVVEKYSDEHEYLLSAKDIRWALDIDGEIYINDNQLSTPIEFGKIYTAQVTQLAGDKLLATIISDT